MTTTTARPRTLGDALREETDLAEIGLELADAVGELIEESRAEARAVGHQYRLIHRMWQLQEEAREQRWAVEADWIPRELDRVGPNSLEPAEQTLRDVADEIGPALRLPAGTALRRVDDAVLLATALPAVLDALEQGLVGIRQVGVIVELWREFVEEGTDLRGVPQAPVEAVRRIAEELLHRAPDCTAAQLRALARRRRSGLLRETEEQRHRLAWRDRRVWIEPREDGMAQLCALLDAATAHAIQDRVDALATRTDPASPTSLLPDLLGLGHARRTPAERTLPQRRADVLSDLLLDGEPAGMPEHLRGIRGHVTVTVPALALLERGGQPSDGGFSRPGELPRTAHCAELEGYGPVPVSMAERIAARAPSWSRILTHPVTGTVFDYDRSAYAVPADLKRRLRVRDGTCRFPGCRRRASRCDIDHTVAWADGGRTAADNLAHLCRHHHLVKHRDGPLGGWRVRQVGPGDVAAHDVALGAEAPDMGARAVGALDIGAPEGGASDSVAPLPQGGVLEWTSPAGQVHRTLPPGCRDALPWQERADDPAPF